MEHAPSDTVEASAEKSLMLRGAEERRTLLLESAKMQLRGYEEKGILKKCIEKIEEEQPDMLVFLDRGARIFATPFLKTLSERGKSVPEIRFYNDDALKKAYLQKTSLDPIIEKDFAEVVGKKIFFIDETFSSGRGMVPLLQAAQRVNIDAT